MQPDIARRFDNDFAPRIAQAIAACFADRVQADVVPYGGHGHPTLVRIHSAPHEHVRGYAYPLNLELTWDIDEIERLMDADGAQRFEHYLAALPRKLNAWEGARDIDLESRTQADPLVRLGGLDFEG
jgi:non-ribosomal peptide synthetase component F